MKKNIIWAIAAVLAVVLFYAGKDKLQGDALAKQDNAAYDFSLKSLDGKIIRLSDFKGKVVILDFWATWCPPCKAEIPSFVSLYNKLGKDGLVIIGAAVDEPGRVAQFVKDNSVTYPVVLPDQTVTDAYGGIRGIPTTFVIDKRGKIVRSYTGYRPEMVFESDFNTYK